MRKAGLAGAFEQKPTVLRLGEVNLEVINPLHSGTPYVFKPVVDAQSTTGFFQI